MNSFPHEHSLIIASASYPLGNVERGAVESDLKANLDWDYLLTRAGTHGITPLMMTLFSELDLMEAVPERCVDGLKKSYLASLMRNKHLYGSLAAVLHEFSANDVPTILLKGAALCLDTYDDMALRPFGDLDILVPRDRIRLCQGLLEELDYRLIEGIYFPIPDDRNDELGCEWSYVRGDSIVELHWNLVTTLNPFDIDLASLWQDTRRLEAEGEPALALSRENQLLHLCLHQYKHHWEHLRDITDIALFIQKHRSRLDWDKLVRDGRRQGIDRCVYYSLGLAGRLLNADIPPEAEHAVADSSGSSRLASGFLDFIADNIFQENLPRRFWELVLVRGNRNRARLVGQIFAHPFPRKGDAGSPAEPKATNLKGRVLEALKSLFYYRKVIFSVPAHLWKAVWRRS